MKLIWSWIHNDVKDNLLFHINYIIPNYSIQSYNNYWCFQISIFYWQTTFYPITITQLYTVGPLIMYQNYYFKIIYQTAWKLQSHYLINLTCFAFPPPPKTHQNIHHLSFSSIKILNLMLMIMNFIWSRSIQR